MFKKILDTITLKAYRDAKEATKRRANYEAIRAKIVARHFAGFNGLTLSGPDKRYDIKDLASFPPPMYAVVKDRDMNWVIFWDPKKMGEEVGGPQTKDAITPAKLALVDDPSDV